MKIKSKSNNFNMEMKKPADKGVAAVILSTDH